MPKLKSNWDWERLAAYLVLAAVGVTMFATILPTLNGNGYLAAWDAGGHLLKAEYFANVLLPHGQLDGWFPLWHGGFGLFQYYPPLLYYLLGPLTYVFQPELALRLFTAALWVGLLPVTYYFLRSFSLSRLPAALGTTLLLSLNASFGIGLGALYGVGLLPNGLGFILAIWALGRLKRDLFELRPTGKIILTGVVVGLLVLSHTFSTYWFLLASGILTIAAMWGRPVWPVLKRYGLVLGIGLALSAYWWLPLLGSFAGMGETGSIQQQSALDIFRGLLLSEDSGGWALSLLALSGLAYLALRRHFRELGFFLATGLLTLLLSINAVNGILPFNSVVGSSQFIRFHAFFALLMMVWAALGIAGAWYAISTLPRRAKPFGIAGFAAALALLIALFIAPTLSDKRGFIRVVENEPTSELPELRKQLESRLQPGEFVLSEFNWNSRFLLGSPHFVNQHLPGDSAVPIWNLDGNFPEGTKGSERPVLIAALFPREGFLAAQRDYLRSRGVRYLVSTHPVSRVSLDTQDWLERVGAGKILTLYELKDFDRPFGLLPAVGAALRSASFDNSAYSLTFDQAVDLPAGTAVALSYHPWLQVRADGKPVATEDHNRQLAFAESVRAKHLTIAYDPPGWVRGSWLVSVLGLLTIAVLVAKRRQVTKWLSRQARRGRRSADSDQQQV